MPREIFIDASAWVALVHTGDNFHHAATNTYPIVQRRWPRWVTTNLVVVEAHTLLRRRGGHAVAMQFLTTVRNTARLVKLYSDETAETEAAQILAQYKDHDFSLADAVSFALMRQRNITEAFAFDHHFLTAGFTLVPAAPV